MPRFGKYGGWQLFLVVITVVLAFASALFFGRFFLAPGLVKQGIAVYDRGDWTAAAALAQARLKTVPDDKQALRLLARSTARQHRDKLARCSLFAGRGYSGDRGRRLLPLGDHHRSPG